MKNEQRRFLLLVLLFLFLVARILQSARITKSCALGCVSYITSFMEIYVAISGRH